MTLYKTFAENRHACLTVRLLTPRRQSGSGFGYSANKVRNQMTNNTLINRRTVLAGLPATGAFLPGTANALTSASEDQKQLDALLKIAENTDHSMDEVCGWFDGLNSNALEKIAENSKRAPFGHVRMINYHARRAMRLLAESAPDGCKPVDQMFVIKDNCIASAYPPNWDHGQWHMNFTSELGWTESPAEHTPTAVR